LIEKKEIYTAVIVAIGDNKTRLSKQQALENAGIRVAKVIHPSAIVSNSASVHKGTVILAGAVVNSFSIIGGSCIINSNSVVEHDCVLADGVHISPAAALAGGVRVGRCSWVGMSSCVIQQVSVCDNVVIGAGSVVIKDIFTKGVYTGIPACRKN
jgi:sugar O-acyltransferase (sialic acid O-acetyltransferase NeuD family)